MTSSGIRRYLIVLPRMYTSEIFQNWSPSCAPRGGKGANVHRWKQVAAP